MIPDLVLKAILSNKKSVGEIFKFCDNTSNTTCYTVEDDDKKTLKNPVAKQIFRLSGYRVDKNFDYSSLFYEMYKILLDHRTDDSKKKNLSLSTDKYISSNALVKISASDRKSLAAKGSAELYAFLLNNGIDLRSQSPTGTNFELTKKESSIFGRKSTIS